ncbi:LARGE xylosyl- and glucuronyltransferase 2 [Clonorchis sinensis]|uniref:LARGE xylosyl- and glucuronyltransferase 2 n=1 Tax=Clonorchis sinensis TaxID=79923 RepID=A0A3R7CE78_CLOSI|nr:LARGE xylosyl- and glucuronyltransferase 2 [Clonorchis sinensis]
MPCLLQRYAIRFGSAVLTFAALSLTLNWYLSNPLDIIKTPTFPKIDLNPTPHTIHLVHVIKGEATLARSITLLKSVLYYRGSLRSKRPECHLRRIPSPHLCAKQRAIEQIAIHLHLVVEQRLLSAAYSYVSQWRVARLNWTLYELDPYLPRVNWIPNKHGSGVAALSKMLIPDMLPTNVTKAIVLDTDILLNADILELWKLFDDFDQSQIFGMAWEFDLLDAKSNNVPIPKNGVNSGVVLMHLSRMREAKWSELFDWAVRKVLILYGTLWLGEQSALNTLIRQRPELYYRIPCEWNLQLWSEVAQISCPAVWTDRLPEEAICPEHESPKHGNLTHPGRPNLVHNNLPRKPESGENTPSFFRTSLNTSKPQTGKALRCSNQQRCSSCLLFSVKSMIVAVRHDFMVKNARINI